MMCEVCGISDKKNRCPVCLINYCSKDCFETHKEKCTRKSSESKSPEVKKPCVSIPRNDTISCEVPDDILDLLSQSEPLKQLLNDPHLQNLLKLMNESKDAERFMQMAMLEPLFVEFILFYFMLWWNYSENLKHRIPSRSEDEEKKHVRKS